MLIRHLDFFVTLAEEGHFGRAAELCGVSQPSLSLAIRKLEEDLGTTLILRGQRFMGLTPEGEKVLVWGRQILADFGSLKDDLSGRRKGGLTGQLRLGVSPSAMALLPRITERFESRNPLAKISIRPMPVAEIRQGIIDLALDGGLLWLDPELAADPAVRCLELGTEGLGFACRSDHPFAGAAVISWRDAATQPLCALSESLPGLSGSESLLPIRPGVSCDSLAGILAHLRHGLWCAVVPESFATLLGPADTIVLRPMSEPEHRLRLAGVVSARMPQSPMSRAFHDCLTGLA